MKFYEAKPGMWLVEGVSIEEHERAMAGNYTPDIDDDWPIRDLIAKSARARDAKRIWRTQSGKEMPYGTLEDSHLNNIIAMLRRNGHSLSNWPNLRREHQKREREYERRLAAREEAPDAE